LYPAIAIGDSLELVVSVGWLKALPPESKRSLGKNRKTNHASISLLISPPLEV
jgi:hypothetical protein